MAAKKTISRPASDLAWLCRALKAPSLAASVERLAERARAEGWTHEEFLSACLEREVASRQDHGGENRIKTARFPARKTIEDFDFRPSAQPQTRRHLPPRNVGLRRRQRQRDLLRPTRDRQTHLATALGIRACQAGHRVAFATAAEWVSRFGEAHSAGRLQAELTRLGRIPLLVIDEVGYIPLEAEAANLFFQLIFSRYERASVIITSNKPFARWGETFGDPAVAAAMIDRLVHHAEVINLKGDNYRLKTATSEESPMTTLRDRGGQKWTVTRGSKVDRC